MEIWILIAVIFGSPGLKGNEVTEFVLEDANGTLNHEEDGGGYLTDHNYIWKLPNGAYDERVLFVQIVEMDLKRPINRRNVLECVADLSIGDHNLVCDLPKTNCRLYGHSPDTYDFKTIYKAIGNANCSAWFVANKFPDEIKLRVFKDWNNPSSYIRHGLRIVVKYQYIETTKTNQESSPTTSPKEESHGQAATKHECADIDGSTNYVAAIVVLVILLCFVSGFLLWEVYRQRARRGANSYKPSALSAVMNPEVNTQPVNVGPYASIGESSGRQEASGSVNPTYSEIGAKKSASDGYYQIPTNRYALQEDDSVNEEEAPAPASTSRDVYAMVNKSRKSGD